MKTALNITLAVAALFVTTQAHAASCKEELFARYDGSKSRITSIERVDLTATTITYGVTSVINTRAQNIKNYEVLTFDLNTCEVIGSKNYPR